MSQEEDIFDKSSNLKKSINNLNIHENKMTT